MNFVLHKEDVNTMVCQSFSDGYHALNQYILKEGIKTESRLGTTYETLNFKTVIQDPLKKSTVSLCRNSNIFFHLAESLWVLTGRDDLNFVEIFNSRFSEYSDDGKILHGAYGNRMRNWTNSEGQNSIDQLFKLTSLLNTDPNSRRSVISLWNPTLDLGKIKKDLPCNTQLVLRVKDDELHLTIFNRSNDLHWGYVANIFQFSFLGEIISLLIDKKFARQTHFSQSLHIYTDNNILYKVEDTDIHRKFHSKYPTTDFVFNFENSTDFYDERFSEIDGVFKWVTNIVLEFYQSETKSLKESLVEIDHLRSKSNSVFEITYLLILYTSYKKDLKISNNQDELRKKYANYLLDKSNTYKFKHKDYFALALNYFVHRMNADSKLDFTIEDPLMGKY